MCVRACVVVVGGGGGTVGGLHNGTAFAIECDHELVHATAQFCRGVAPQLLGVILVVICEVENPMELHNVPDVVL